MESNRFDDAEADAPFDWSFFESLPDGYLANALALTSPRDVGRLSTVCSGFRSAAEWDAVWEAFLPPEYEQILAEAEGGSVTPTNSRKELYLSLCDHPVIIDGGNKSFWLDKSSGKKCYMLAAGSLSICWGDNPEYWRWIPLSESRFAKVAELLTVCWFDVNGRIDSSMLSNNTRYAAYLVYKLTGNVYGFDYPPFEVSFGLSDAESQIRMVFLEVPIRRRRSMNLDSDEPKRRQDGWLEIELGEFFNEMGQEGELKMSVREVKHLEWKGGLIIQGVEIRPMAGKI